MTRRAEAELRRRVNEHAVTLAASAQRPCVAAVGGRGRNTVDDLLDRLRRAGEVVRSRVYLRDKEPNLARI